MPTAEGATDGDPAEPQFSLPSGEYDRAIQLSIAAEEADAAIFYTLDGSTPTMENAMRYDQPIRLSPSTPAVTVIRARVIGTDGSAGPVAEAVYVVGVDATLPIASVTVDPADLYGQEWGIFANPRGRGLAWERPAILTYFDQAGETAFQLPVGVRVHGLATRDQAKKSLRIYFRREYGASRLEYPLFVEVGSESGQQAPTYKRLVIHNGGQDSPLAWPATWTLLRNQLVARLASDMAGYVPESRPVLLFINGESYGIYQLRERIDDHFLKDKYGVEEADLLETPDRGGLDGVAAGSRDPWDQLLAFVETHDLADATDYAYVASQIDIDNFIDYNLLQIYIVNVDWPHRNVNLFRSHAQGGRWQWIFWDTDLAFGLSPWLGVETDMFTKAIHSDHRETEGRDSLLLHSLMQNPDFKLRFLRRMSDLLNTTLSPEQVIDHVDSLAGELQADIRYEDGRWSSASEWASNVDQMRDFARRRTEVVRQHALAEFSIPGTANLTVNPPSGGPATIAINGYFPGTLPWTGTYFQGMRVKVTAVPQPGYRFDGWQELASDENPVTLTMDADQHLTPRFVLSETSTPAPGDVRIVDYGGDETSDWVELRVTRSGVDMRGWRLTDNDTKTATDEGSLILGEDPVLEDLGVGTRVRLVANSLRASGNYPVDDLDGADGRLTLYSHNKLLDDDTDPWFKIGANENLTLLAPGPTVSFADDIAIAFFTVDPDNPDAVTPGQFGALADGVRVDIP